LINDSKTYNLNELDEEADYNKIFYKDRWIKEDLSSRKIKDCQRWVLILSSVKF